MSSQLIGHRTEPVLTEYSEVQRLLWIRVKRYPDRDTDAQPVTF
jgi:hypothetical protein